MEFDHHSQNAFQPFFNLEIFNSAMELAFSPDHSSPSGYLQDAISPPTSRLKRQRLTEPAAAMDDHSFSENLILNYWYCNFDDNMFGSEMLPWIREDDKVISDDPLSSSIYSISNGSSSMKDSPQAAASESDGLSSSPALKASVSADGLQSQALECPLPSEANYSSRRVMAGKRVAYPFALVKPGGVEGDVTLAEINERILMRPTRPIRHPVGEFACHPFATGRRSGKAVVALTRIHTQGRGTVTIIRTRG